MIKRCTQSITGLCLLNSLGGLATKKSHRSSTTRATPHERPLASEAEYRPSVSTSLFNLTLRGIELYFLPQVTSEIGRDRQTPEMLAKLKRLEGQDAEGQRSGVQGGCLHQSQQPMQLVVESRTRFVHVSVTFDLLLVYTNITRLFLNKKGKGFTKKNFS